MDAALVAASLSAVVAVIRLDAGLAGVLGVTLLAALAGADFFSGAAFPFPDAAVPAVCAGGATVFAAVLSVARAEVPDVFLVTARDADFTVSGASLRATLSVAGGFFASVGVFALRGAVCAAVFTDFLRDAFFAVSIPLFLLLLSVTMDAYFSAGKEVRETNNSSTNSKNFDKPFRIFVLPEKMR
ncbi:MAG: hypothetical protein LBF51_01620 [Zoogloeaceae bacterium]|jgi:hypothetical protein|nr:hypothetical protein [Zoogloeaceae bacterium]